MHSDCRMSIEEWWKMSSISEYEGSKILEFFKHHPDNEKKLISIAKTITKNTLTHLCLNGEINKLINNMD